MRGVGADAVGYLRHPLEKSSKPFFVPLTLGWREFGVEPAPR
jgi:hypothetical protein